MSDAEPLPFHAIVRVMSNKPLLEEINGCRGRVSGMSEHSPIEYSVYIYDRQRTWVCSRSDLEVTSEIDQEAVRISEQHHERLKAKWGDDFAAHQDNE